MEKHLIALMTGLAFWVACAGPDQGISDAGTAEKADVSLMRMDLRNDNIEAVASFE